MTWAWTVDLPMGPKATLVALANFADGDGVCYPGQVRLARMVGCGERSVRRYIDDLEAAGIIDRHQRRRADGSRTSDEYRLVGFLQPANLAGSTAEPTGQSDRTNRPICPGLPANLTGHEPSVEPSVEPPGTSLVIAEEFSAFKDAWNENRRGLPAVAKLTDARKARLRALLKQHGADALAVFIDATRAVAVNSFWTERQYGFDNLLAGDKVTGYAEQWRAGGVRLGSGNLRMATQVANWARALEGADGA